MQAYMWSEVPLAGFLASNKSDELPMQTIASEHDKSFCIACGKHREKEIPTNRVVKLRDSRVYKVIALTPINFGAASLQLVPEYKVGHVYCPVCWEHC